ncbi:MAG: ATP-binding protein, partial [Candidatus Binatia bacterium]
ICLANGEGGVLLVGVEDDGHITGARPRHEAGITDPRRVQALIANNTRPSLTVEAEVVEMNGKSVLAITVPEATQPTGTADGVYKRRAMGGRGEPICLPYHFHEMQSRLADQGILDYSTLVVSEATWDDLDPLEFERMRRMIRESRGRGDASLVKLPDKEVAKALGVVEEGSQGLSIRVGALLLFGQEEALRRYLPTHEVAFQALKNSKVETNEFFRWPLFRVAEEVLSRFRARNREEEIMIGMVRLGVPDYAESAFREALTNALIHRDYTQLGAVHIQWHLDRIEISNPGGFPQGVHLDNLLSTAPRPRNPVLADGFKRAGLVERTGRGIDLIFEGQLRYGRPAPDYSQNSDQNVAVTLQNGPANLAFARFVAEQDREDQPLSLEDLLILNELEQERSLTVKRVAKLLQRSEATARTHLNQMVERGLLEARGATRARRYQLTAAVYRALGQETGYVRTRVQQEQMVLQYVRAHGRITRGETAELCRISPYQARYLLQRLVKQGKLVLQGKRRGAYYEHSTKNMD